MRFPTFTAARVLVATAIFAAVGATTYAAVAVPDVAGGAEAAEPAERIGPGYHEGPIFPIQVEPRCELVNGFGGYSKARGGGGHQGIDIGATEGQEIYAVEDGVLYREFDGANSGLGWGLLTEDGDKYRFYHMAGFAPDVALGAFVQQGQVIGYVGDTGNAAPGGWHLHFEYRPAPTEDPVNPYPFLEIPEGCKDYIGG